MPDFSTISSLSELVPIQHIVFWIMTACTIIGGLGVVASRSLFHSAIFLILSLFGVAGYFVILDAGFLAVVQLLIYVGAIAVLILFAIMFDRQAAMTTPARAEAEGGPGGQSGEHNRQWWLSLPVVIVFFFILMAAVGSVPWPAEAPPLLVEEVRAEAEAIEEAAEAVQEVTGAVEAAAEDAVEVEAEAVEEAAEEAIEAEAEAVEAEAEAVEAEAEAVEEAAELDMVTQLGTAFLGSYLIPFEVVGVLLSVALIGGVILARERTKEEANEC